MKTRALIWIILVLIIIQLAAASDIVNSSFETGWDGFTNGAGGAPGPSSGTFSATRSTEQAHSGAYSVKATYGANPSETSLDLYSPSFSPLVTPVFARVWFYRTGNVPNCHNKWIRFQWDVGSVRGGLYLASTAGGNPCGVSVNGVSWSEAANGNYGIDLGIGVPTANTWHSIEVEYDRSSWNVVGRGPRERFWYDGAVQVAGSQPGGMASSSGAYWGADNGNPNVNGPWLYAGVADTAAYPSLALGLNDNFNAGNTQAGAFYYDDIEVSTQRIGTVGTAPPSTDTTPPSTPTGLSATAVSSTQISLTWSASSDNVGVTGYRVYRNGAQIATPATSSYTDTGLSAGTTYVYTVVAYDAAGNTGNQSTAVQATTQSQNTNSTGQGDLNVDGKVDFLDLLIVINDFRHSGTAIQNTRTDINNDGTVNLFDFVLLTKNWGKVYNSADSSPPTAPTGLSATAATSSQINLAWTTSTDNVGVTGYMVYRCQGAGCTPSTQVATPTTISYQDTSLSASTTYVYKVAAKDAAGNPSPQSNSAQATTSAAADTTPPAAIITAPSANQVLAAGTPNTILNVTTNESATCKYSTSNQAYANMTTTFTTTGATSHSTSITVANGQSYTYYVRCQDIAGNAMTTSATISFSVRASASGLLFQSDWSTATGTSDAALRDTSKAVPWATFTNDNAILSVISATGKGFPSGMKNILQVKRPAVASTFGWVQQSGVWSTLAVGQSLYYRVYIRVEYADSEVAADGSNHHPIQAATRTPWDWHWGNAKDGTFPIYLMWDDNPFPSNMWYISATYPGTNLKKNATYRLEWAVTRQSSGFLVAARIYDTDDTTLLYADSGNTKITNSDGSQTLSTMGANNVVNSAENDFDLLELGSNGGPTYTTDQYHYFGGMCVRSDAWCGPYTGG